MGVYNESVGVFLAPIQAFLEDDSVSEILINGPDEVFVERRGILERTDAKFHDEQALQAAVRNIAQFVSRRIDDDNPTLDARLRGAGPVFRSGSSRRVFRLSSI